MFISCLPLTELLAHSFLFVFISQVAKESWLPLEVKVCHKIDFLLSKESWVKRGAVIL